MIHSFHQEIDKLVKKGKLPSFVAEIMRKFYQSYVEAAVQNGYTIEAIEPRLLQLLHFAVKQITFPYRFEPYHKKITRPFNYYKFGLDFIRPLIDFKKSTVVNEYILDKIEDQLKSGENVIFLANHQIEPDPQVISVLLENKHPRIAEDLIFIAGNRVISDPLAVPFSLGRNLICIYSKKHIENPIEQKANKLIHNQRSMKKMASLLTEGGKCIYVAPSGGRDRPNADGQVFPSDFDSQSIEMFLLMAKKAKTPTHFYPLILSTYQILPPPNTVEKDIGERRHASCAPVHLQFEDEVDMNAIVDHIPEKTEKRKIRAEILTKIIQDAYLTLIGGPSS
jgi:glycerol-3-phosphate O-acyltransferase